MKMKVAVIGTLLVLSVVTKAQEMDILRTNYTLISQDANEYRFWPTVDVPNVVAWGTGGVTNIPTDLTNVIQVAAGNSHAIALKNDGTVEGWGDDSFGEIDAPTAVIGTNTIQLVAGNGFSISLLNNGGIVAWGRFYGVSTGAVVTLSQSAIQIASADTNNLTAILADGTIANITNTVETDSSVNGYQGIASASTIAGRDEWIAIHGDGSVTNWGYNDTNQPTFASAVTDVAVCSSKAAAVTSTGIGQAWNLVGSGTVTSNGIYQASGYAGNLWFLGTNGVASRISGSIVTEPAGTLPLSFIAVGQNAVVGIEQ